MILKLKRTLEGQSRTGSIGVTNAVTSALPFTDHLGPHDLAHANYPPLRPKHVHFVAFSVSCFRAHVFHVSLVL